MVDGRGVFFFQAEDGIRDWSVTGVQTCALPISVQAVARLLKRRPRLQPAHQIYPPEAGPAGPGHPGALAEQYRLERQRNRDGGGSGERGVGGEGGDGGGAGGEEREERGAWERVG